MTLPAALYRTARGDGLGQRQARVLIRRRRRRGRRGIHRPAARRRARGVRRVGHAARVHIGLGHRVTPGAGQRLRGRQSRRLRRGAGERPQQRIADRHPTQRHVAGIGGDELIADDVAGRVVRAARSDGLGQGQLRATGEQAEARSGDDPGMTVSCTIARKLGDVQWTLMRHPVRLGFAGLLPPNR